MISHDPGKFGGHKHCDSGDMFQWCKGKILHTLASIRHYYLQSNLCITTTWGTKFLWSLQTGGSYKEDLCKTAKTVNSDIQSLYKGSISFHFITHDTNKNKSAGIFIRNAKLYCDKTTYYK